MVETTLTSVPASPPPIRTAADRRTAGRSGRFAAMIVITVIALVPVGGVVWLSLRPGLHSQDAGGLTLGNFAYVFGESQLLEWLLKRPHGHLCTHLREIAPDQLIAPHLHTDVDEVSPVLVVAQPRLVVREEHLADEVAAAAHPLWHDVLEVLLHGVRGNQPTLSRAAPREALG
jgi:hypothetical protein